MSRWASEAEGLGHRAPNSRQEHGEARRTLEPRGKPYWRTGAGPHEMLERRPSSAHRNASVGSAASIAMARTRRIPSLPIRAQLVRSSPTMTTTELTLHRVPSFAQFGIVPNLPDLPVQNARLYPSLSGGAPARLSSRDAALRSAELNAS
jgi:hypothetical protein